MGFRRIASISAIVLGILLVLGGCEPLRMRAELAPHRVRARPASRIPHGDDRASLQPGAVTGVGADMVAVVIASMVLCGDHQ